MSDPLKKFSNSTLPRSWLNSGLGWTATHFLKFWFVVHWSHPFLSVQCLSVQSSMNKVIFSSTERTRMVIERHSPICVVVFYWVLRRPLLFAPPFFPPKLLTSLSKLLPSPSINRVCKTLLNLYQVSELEKLENIYYCQMENQIWCSITQWSPKNRINIS